MGKDDSRGLFVVYAIDKDTDEVVYKSGEVVAESEREAIFESDLKDVLKEKK